LPTGNLSSSACRSLGPIATSEGDGRGSCAPSALATDTVGDAWRCGMGTAPLPLDNALLASPSLAIVTLVATVRAEIPLSMARIAKRVYVLAAAGALKDVTNSRLVVRASAKDADIRL